MNRPAWLVSCGVLSLAAALPACSEEAPRAVRAVPEASMLAGLPAPFLAPQDPPKPPPAPEAPAGQEGKAPAPPAPAAEEPPKQPPAEANDPASLAARIGDLHARVARRPGPPASTGADADAAKARAAAAKAQSAWEEDVRALAAAGDKYLAVAGDAADARTLFRIGHGKAVFAGRHTAEQALDLRVAAAGLLTKALAGAKPDDDFRPDAEHALGQVQLSLAAAGRVTWEDAAAHLREAALRYRAAGRRDESGRAAFLALDALLKNGKEEAARALAGTIGADKEDFGVSTPSVRVLAQRTATSVGAKLPDLPEALDADGRALNWGEFRGHPLLLHFFQAARTTGHLSQEKDVGSTLRPLHAELSPKGLRAVGISMDLALTKEQVARIRANWDEWGVNEHVQDGSLDAVRAWAADEGLTWTWVWDGKGDQNPLSKALGGCGRSMQHAVLVDAEGVIRWRGDAPFVGLPEAARKVCGAAPK